MTPWPFIVVCALATAALIEAERRGSELGKWLSKPVASAAFVGLALASGATDSVYGVTVLAALLLCLIGDLLLIPIAVGPAFLAGLGSFLLGHVAFCVAFVVAFVTWPVAALAAVVLAGPALLILRWLRPRLTGPMRIAVPAYILVITVMVALAVGAALPGQRWLIAIGAFSFFLSDISVARDRFVSATWLNRLWGLPLYYGATCMLALTV
jgi:uncharacterized membrane protein YhhN